MKSFFRMLLALAAGTTVSTSCLVSDSYSTDDIDLSMKLFEDQFELPVGTTGKLKLEDFLDGESSGILITMADGSYAESISGKVSDIKIEGLPNFLSSAASHVVTSGGAAGNCIKESNYVQATLGAAVKGGVTVDPKSF